MSENFQNNQTPPQPPQFAQPQTPPKTSGLAIASLVLGILGVLTAIFLIGFLFSIVGIILGIVAISKINKDPAELSGKGLAIGGIATSCASFALLFLLALIAIPNFINLREKAYDASAKSAGRNAKLAQEVFYNDVYYAKDQTYTTDLNVLLKIDKHLIDDPGVTFNFLYGSTDGFTLTTTHKDGTGKEFMYQD